MEHTSNFFSKHGKAAQSVATKIIAIAILVLIVAVAVYFFRTSKVNPIGESQKGAQQNTQVEQQGNENLAGEIDKSMTPENVDPTMIESDLNQTSKNLETIDNLDNF